MKTEDGWEYNVTTVGDDFKLEVIAPNVLKKILPATLFKYYALNCDNVDALKNAYIYASEPSQLNDPFDCHPNLIEYDSSLVEILKKRWVKELQNVPQEQHNELALRFHYYKKISHLGVISMTTKPDNTLMWAHYAQNKGFVLEFDFKNFDKSIFGPFPINYSEELEIIPSLTEDDNLPCFLRQTNVKSLEWKYEDEWRFLAFKKEPMYIPSIGSKDEFLQNRKFNYVNSLKSITVGSLFFEEIKSWEGQMAIKLTGLNLCVVQFALQNSIDLYCIQNPKFHSEKQSDFKLLRKKIQLFPVDENTYLFNINN